MDIPSKSEVWSSVPILKYSLISETFFRQQSTFCGAPSAYQLSILLQGTIDSLWKHGNIFFYMMSSYLNTYRQL